jgi:hypothetical protein
VESFLGYAWLFGKDEQRPLVLQLRVLVGAEQTAAAPTERHRGPPISASKASDKPQISRETERERERERCPKGFPLLLYG